MNKMIRDGKVAVLVSPGYGAGWSTWNSGHPEVLYDPVVVQMVLDDRRDDIEPYCDRVYGDSEIYCGGARDLEVCWLPVGTQFRVNEYDGYESIVTNADEIWFVA